MFSKARVKLWYLFSTSSLNFERLRPNQLWPWPPSIHGPELHLFKKLVGLIELTNHHNPLGWLLQKKGPIGLAKHPMAVGVILALISQPNTTSIDEAQVTLCSLDNIVHSFSVALKLSSWRTSLAPQAGRATRQRRRTARHTRGKRHDHLFRGHGQKRPKSKQKMKRKGVSLDR